MGPDDIRNHVWDNLSEHVCRRVSPMTAIMCLITAFMVWIFMEADTKGTSQRSKKINKIKKQG